jgi:hypothetical protein
MEPTFLDPQAVADAIDALRAQAIDEGDPDALVEAELLSALLLAWQDAQAQADDVTLEGEAEATPDDIGGFVARLGLLFGAGFFAQAFTRFVEVLRRGYADAATRTIREASGPLAGYVLGGPDERALAWLAEDSAFYIRSYADRRTVDRIRAAGDEILSAGLSRQRAGELFAERLEATYGQGQRYWTLLAANVTTRSREYGRIAGYVAAGVTEVYVSAVRDRRTSDVCKYLDGRRVSVADLVAQRDAVLAITEPRDIRTVAPWRTVDEVRALVQANGGEVPASVGVPPYHAHCRTRTTLRPPRR